MIFRGVGAFTFMLKEAKAIGEYAKYDLRIGKRWITCDLKFEINKGGKSPGFKILGHGEDNNKEFTIKSEYKFDKNFLENWDDALVTKDGDDAGIEFDSFKIDRKSKQITGSGKDDQGIAFTIEGEMDKNLDVKPKHHTVDF
jgi:hypothetical protein